MTEVAPAAALVLAGVFGWAAMAKVRHRRATVTSFRGLGLPAPGALAVVVPAVEAGVATGLVLLPGPSSYVALVLVLAFSMVVARAVARRADVACACFGSGAHDRPVSVLELVRNGGIGGLAIVATGAGSAPAGWPGLPALAVIGLLVALGRAGLAAADLRRARRVS